VIKCKYFVAKKEKFLKIYDVQCRDACHDIEIFMSHVMEIYVMTCHMSRHNQVSQLKLLLMKMFSYSDSNMLKYQLINQQYLMMKSISNIAHTYVTSSLITMNGKVCIIRRYLCHNIESLCHIISWSFMSRHVICHDYRSIISLVQCSIFTL